MKRAIIFELKKLCKEKFLWASVVLLLTLNCFYIDKYYKETAIEGCEKVLEDFSGPITTEKARAVKNVVDSLKGVARSRTYDGEYDVNLYTGYEETEYTVFRDIYDEMRRRYLYSEFAKEKKEDCLRIALRAENVGNKGVKSLNLKMADRLEGRAVSDFYDTKAFEKSMEWKLDVLGAAALAGVAVFLLFFREDNGNMGAWFKLSRISSAKIFAAKKCAVLIVGIGALAAVRFVSFVTFGAFSYPGLLFSKLYSVKAFETSMFSGSILIFLLLEFLVDAMFFAAVVDLLFVFQMILPYKNVAAVLSGFAILAFLTVSRFFCLWATPACALAFSNIAKKPNPVAGLFGYDAVIFAALIWAVSFDILFTFISRRKKNVCNDRV